MKIFSFFRRRPKSSIAAGIILILLIVGIGYASQPAQPEYVTDTVRRADVRQTVEAVGKIVSERELQLRFAGVGIVGQVFVKEGDRVNAGQRLAQLRAGSLAAGVASQAASLQSAQAELQKLLEGSRPEDIAIAEAQVQNRRASLDAARSSLKTAENNLRESQAQLIQLESETQTNLAGEMDDARTTLSLQLVAGQNALAAIDDVFTKTVVQDAIIKFRPGADNEIIAAKRRAWDAIIAAQTAGAVAKDYQVLLRAMEQGRTALTNGAGALTQAYALIVELPETGYLTASDRAAFKDTLETARGALQTAISGIGGAKSSFESAAAGYDTRIAAERASLVASEGARAKAQADISTYETALRTEEASLALEKAGARKTDVDAARARVRAAQANLARAQADVSDTVLTAPIAGTVTHVNIKTGESLPSGAAVSLLGDSPFRVEMFVSEIDIPKVLRTQSGSIELDAFRGTNFKLRVGEADSASTQVDGVPKYRLKLDFVHPHNELKIGMTGDAEVITGTRDQVLVVPRRAVIENTEGKTIVRVLKADATVEERPVTMGMEGESGDVEITTGLTEGEVVIVLVKK